jgi:2'-5' RNA ligase
MNQTRRLFFALEAGDQLRQAVHTIQQGLGIEGRAVRPEQFHVTLAFLGQQADTLIPDLNKIGDSLSLMPCTIMFDRTGYFSGSRVLWLGASHVPDSLLTFRQSLVDALSESGIAYDQRAWKLHLTLYRRLRKPAGRIENISLSWRLNGFSLMESVNRKNGVEYHRLGYWETRCPGN